MKNIVLALAIIFAPIASPALFGWSESFPVGGGSKDHYYRELAYMDPEKFKELVRAGSISVEWFEHNTGYLKTYCPQIHQFIMDNYSQLSR